MVDAMKVGLHMVCVVVSRGCHLYMVGKLSFVKLLSLLIMTLNLCWRSRTLLFKGNSFKISVIRFLP